MIYKLTKQQIDAYFEDKTAVSQSVLKSLIGGIDYYNAKIEEALKNEKYFDEPADHFIIGSAVDCKLTQQEGDFDMIYHISNLVKKPSDTIVSILKMVFDQVTENIDIISPLTIGGIQSYSTVVLAACEYHSYQSRWGDEAKINAVTREGEEYWNELILSSGKQILTYEQSLLINRIVNSIKFDHSLEMYFNNTESQEMNIDVFCQLQLKGRIRDVNCKAMIDLLIVDHANTEMFIIDIKTMGDTVLNFRQAMRKRRYDIQASFYHDLLNSNRSLNNLDEILREMYGYEGVNVNSYRLINPMFIVQSTKFDNSPVLYQTTTNLLRMGKKGRLHAKFPYVVDEDESMNVQSQYMENIKGYLHLLNDYDDLIETGTIKHPFMIELDWDQELIIRR